MAANIRFHYDILKTADIAVALDKSPSTVARFIARPDCPLKTWRLRGHRVTSRTHMDAYLAALGA